MAAPIRRPSPSARESWEDEGRWCRGAAGCSARCCCAFPAYGGGGGLCCAAPFFLFFFLELLLLHGTRSFTSAQPKFVVSTLLGLRKERHDGGHWTGTARPEHEQYPTHHGPNRPNHRSYHVSGFQKKPDPMATITDGCCRLFPSETVVSIFRKNK